MPVLLSSIELWVEERLDRDEVEIEDLDTEVVPVLLSFVELLVEEMLERENVFDKLLLVLRDFEVVGIVSVAFKLVGTGVVLGVSEARLVLAVDDFDVVEILCVVFGLVVSGVSVAFEVISVVF